MNPPPQKRVKFEDRDQPGTSISRNPLATGAASTDPEAQGALDLRLLPSELLLQVLSHVPPLELLQRCRRVCKAWRELVDSRALWLLILARDHSALLPIVRECLPAGDAGFKFLARFCLLRPLGRNLIRNPCGQDGLQQWMVEHGGHGWVVEPNLFPVPSAPTQTCFVTSFRWCNKKQILDLEEEGFWPELLGAGKIEILVSDWWGARHDCGCQYQLLVQLLDASQTPLDEFSAEPEPIDQWNNCACHHVTHVFSNIQRKVRFVSFQHWGKDTQHWAGHYGARVTNSSVIVRVCPSIHPQ